MNPVHRFAAILAVPVVLWLMGGFVVMEFDPRLWSEAGRFTLVWLCTCGWLALAAFAFGSKR